MEQGARSMGCVDERSEVIQRSGRACSKGQGAWGVELRMKN